MGKILLLNGSPHKDGCTYTALKEVADTLEANGVETELLWIGVQPVAGCIACGKCRQTGKCIFDDMVNGIVEKIDTYDGLVAGSPVYYAGASGQICSLLDRLFYVSGGRMAGKVAASVVSCRRGGATAAFERLDKYFGMNNMVIATSQYWNQIHGNTREEALQDAEGLQTMRTLAQNIAWLVKCIEAGREKGIALPVYEPRQGTNFIR